ncbi:MAG: transcriptional regulator [Massilia sp.]|nr:transcriptional regulator [Massilia sp.]
MKILTMNLRASDSSLKDHLKRSPDQRVVRSKATVLNSTVELLLERGYGATTVDEISRRSGVAKTTIYRHWPTRTVLLRDACSKIGTPLDRPNTGDLKDDLTAVMKNLASLLRSAKWASVLPSIIDAAERDPDIAAMYSELQQEYSSVLQDVLSEAVKKGKLPKNVDVCVLIALLVGPLFYRRWFSREVVSDTFAEQIIARVFP